MSPNLRTWILEAAGVLGPLVTKSGQSPKSRHHSHGDSDDDDAEDEEDEDDEEEEEYLWGEVHSMRDNKKNRLLRALQYSFTFLQHSDKRYFNPRGFVNESAALKLMDGHLSQNDAIEFYSRLIDYLEEVSQGRAQCSKLQDMLHVRTCTMNVRNCDGKHRTESEVGTPFLTLNVRSGMAGPTLHTLDDALESWFKSEKLSGLECEVCNLKDHEQRFDADQIKCFSKLPPVLVVQLQRFDFDYETMQPTKLNHRVSFEHRIDLHRFTRDAVMEKFATSPAAASSAGDDGIEEGDATTPSTPLDAASDDGEAEGQGGGSSRQIRGPSDPLRGVGQDDDEESSKHKDPVANVSSGADAAKAQGGQRSTNSVYQLAGVVVHQGSGANFGHYYSFIRDRKSGKWFRFDDERVTPFDVRNLEEECFGGVSGGMDDVPSWGGGANPAAGGGMNKYKSFHGAKDNNAYLLLYELTTEVDALQGSQSAEQPPHGGAHEPVVPSPRGHSAKWSMARCAWIATRAQVWLRKARLSLTAKARLKKTEMDVWEDNQRTLRHGLVMVPLFMQYCHSLLQSVTDDERETPVSDATFAQVTQMGLLVAFKATIRVYTQKSRLRVWQQTLLGLLRQCTQRAPRVLEWLLEMMSQPSVRQENMESLLQRCPEKVAREFGFRIMELTVSTCIDLFDSAKSVKDGDAHLGDVTDALIRFVEAMVDLLPEGQTSCRFMAPYFMMWRALCRSEDMRNLLLEDGIVMRLLRLYHANDPSQAAAMNRHRGMSLEMGGAMGVGQNANVDADFSGLLDTVSLLLVGSTADAARKRDLQARVAGTYASDLACGLHLSPTSILDEWTEEDGSPPSTEEIGQDAFVAMFVDSGDSFRALRFARGLPLQDGATQPTDVLSDAAAEQIARRDPGPGALLLALKCKGNSVLSERTVNLLASNLDDITRLNNVASTRFHVLCTLVRKICRALYMLGTIEDGYSHDRCKNVVASCLQCALRFQKDLDSLMPANDYHRSSRYATQRLDSEPDEMHDLFVYSIYKIAKTLGELFWASPACRFWLQQHEQHWRWLPRFVDEHSYARCLGGNPDTHTRAVSKGRVVRNLLRAAVCANPTGPNESLTLLEPHHVSIEVRNAGTPECNGIFHFDGFFRAGESQQIDTVTPKFVKMVNGKPLSLYRCLIKDKKFTWYISELSARPGTNNDVDYYSSAKGNPSPMPPDGEWAVCGNGAKPPPSIVQVLRSPFEPDFDPCKLSTRFARRASSVSSDAQRIADHGCSDPPAPPAAQSATGIARELGDDDDGLEHDLGPDLDDPFHDDDEEDDDDDEEDSDDSNRAIN